jgi:hypothetical protein
LISLTTMTMMTMKPLIRAAMLPMTTTGTVLNEGI